MTQETLLPPEDDSEDAGSFEGTPEAAAAAAPAVTPAIPKPKAASKRVAQQAAKVEAPVEVIPAAKRVKIILEENDNIPPTGLFIGVNGRSFLIRAGEEVEVPVEVVEALNDAVEDVPRTDGNSNVVDYRKKMRFPYRLLGR